MGNMGIFPNTVYISERFFNQWNELYLLWVIATLFPKVEHDSRGQKPQFVLALPPPPTLSPILLTKVTRKSEPGFKKIVSLSQKYGENLEILSQNIVT